MHIHASCWKVGEGKHTANVECSGKIVLSRYYVTEKEAEQAVLEAVIETATERMESLSESQQAKPLSPVEEAAKRGFES